MKLIALHVAQPREVEWDGERVSTSIFKDPATGPLRVGLHNIEGDKQADLNVHGGEFKAVYAYSAEHYPWWMDEMGVKTLPFGSFGENLTIQDFDEQRVCVGDHFQIGECVLEAAQPRMPCFKLGIRFADMSIIKRFMDSGRWGIYFRVVREGSIKVGDKVEKVFEQEARVPVSDMYHLVKAEQPDLERVEALLEIPTLCPRWRKKLRGVLER